jgi:hypothetical protein
MDYASDVGDVVLCPHLLPNSAAEIPSGVIFFIYHTHSELSWETASNASAGAAKLPEVIN